MIINIEQINELKQYISKLDTLIENDDVQDLLDAIDDIIIDDILGNNDEPGDLGIRLQRIYDEINSQN